MCGLDSRGQSLFHIGAPIISEMNEFANIHLLAGRHLCKNAAISLAESEIGARINAINHIRVGHGFNQ
jgi:hypothetical protein